MNLIEYNWELFYYSGSNKHSGFILLLNMLDYYDKHGQSVKNE